jgi:hypothetical protein
LMLKHYCIGLIEMLRYFDHDRFLFELPEYIEDSIGDDHHVGLVFILFLILYLLFT